MPAWAWKWVFMGMAAGVIIGSFAAVLPLRAGAAALKRMEF